MINIIPMTHNEINSILVYVTLMGAMLAHSKLNVKLNVTCVVST
jgi:hypothetical protein